MNQHRTIGQVAKAVGISAKTIRYYEEIQLLKAAKRMENTYREYSDEDIARLRLIKQARALGLPIGEVKQLVVECLDGSCEHLRERFLMKLPTYIASIKERVTQLNELHEQLEGLQKNLSTLHLSHPQKKAVEKECCEVLEQMEGITKDLPAGRQEGRRLASP